MTDHLNRWEKAALFATGAGGAYNILLYQLGYTLADAVPGQVWLFGSRVLFALVSFIGFDLTLVVTVRAMREGRRSVWAWVTVFGAALAAAGIALDVSAVLPAPVLHAAPVLVLAAFMLHLAAPKAGERVAELRAAVAREAQRAAQFEAQAADLAARVADAEQAATRAWEDAGTQVAQAGAEVAQERERAAQLDRDLAQARRDLARRPQEDGAAWLVFSGQRVTLAQLTEATGTPSTTLRRKLAQVVGTTAQAAD